MCQNINDVLKKPLYQMATQGSRSVAEIGRGTGWDWLKNEGKKGEKNPGYALTRAAETAALAAAAYYAPEAYSSMVASPEAYAAATPGLSAGGQQAAMLAAQTGDFGAQGLLQTASAGGNPYAAVLGKMVSGSGTGSGANLLASQMGAKMLQPQQPQQMPQSRSFQGGNVEPLPPPGGQPVGNSSGLPGLLKSPDEILKRKLAELRARGLLA